MVSRKLLGLVLAFAAAGHATAHSSQAAHDTPAAELHGAAPFESASHKPLPLQVFAPNDGKDPWTEKYGGSPDYGFTGIATYAHLPSDKCLENRSATFDVAVLGIPFDGAVRGSVDPCAICETNPSFHLGNLSSWSSLRTRRHSFRVAKAAQCSRVLAAS